MVGNRRTFQVRLNVVVANVSVHILMWLSCKRISHLFNHLFLTCWSTFVNGKRSHLLWLSLTLKDEELCYGSKNVLGCTNSPLLLPPNHLHSYFPVSLKCSYFRRMEGLKSYLCEIRITITGFCINNKNIAYKDDGLHDVHQDVGCW